MQKFGEQFCEGVSRDDLRSNTWRYIWRAAAAGNVTAMSEFVRDPGIYGDPAASADGWAIYRDHVQDIDARAIAAGDRVLEARRDAQALSSNMSTSSAQLPPVNQYSADATFDAGMNCVQ